MAKLRQLRYLSLSSSRITDAVIDTVAMLPALEELMVDYPSITDVGAERLCDLRKLKCRSLNDRLISDATARQLKERIPIVEVLSR